MKRRLKRIVALLLAIVMIFCSISSCSKGNFRFGDDAEEDKITRNEWIEMLATTFGFITYSDATQHYTDVTTESAVFDYVQSCYEWGILQDVVGEFNGEEEATVEFATTTAAYAIGCDLADFEGDTNKDKALQLAKLNKFVADNVDYSKGVTDIQCQQILEKARTMYLEMPITPVCNVVFNETVDDLRESVEVERNSENEYSINNFQAAVGDVIILPATDDYPGGRAVKVENVIIEADGSSTISVSEPAMGEVFSELEYTDVLVPEFEDIIPAEGVTVRQLTTATASQQNMNSESNYLINHMLQNGENADFIKTNSNGASFEFEVKFSDGEVTYTPKIVDGNTSVGLGISKEAEGIMGDIEDVYSLIGADAENTESALNAYKEGIISLDTLKAALDVNPSSKIVPTMRDKCTKGYEISGKIAINDFSIVPHVDLKWELTKWVLFVPIYEPRVGKLSVQVDFDADVSLSFTGKLEREISLCVIPIGNGLVTVDVEFFLYAKANGGLAIRAAVDNDTKVEYTNGGWKSASNRSATASIDANVTAEAGPGIRATLVTLGIKIIDATLTAGARIKSDVSLMYNREYHQDDGNMIINMNTKLKYGVIGYLPIITLGLGVSSSTLANKLNLKYQNNLVSEENAIKFKIIPETEELLWEDTKILKINDEKVEEEGNLDISLYFIAISEAQCQKIEHEYPKGYEKDDFIWETSDPEVVTVSDGVVTAVGPGVTRVTVRSTDGEYFAQCAVYVMGITENIQSTDGGGSR